LPCFSKNLTVNETSFFPQPSRKLDLLQKSVLEEILRHKQEREIGTSASGGAGCSAGQEAYSVAILIADALAYYYLAQPASLRNAFAEALILRHGNLKSSRRTSATPAFVPPKGIYNELQMEP